MANVMPEEACSLPECRAGKVDVPGGKVEVRAFEPPPDQRSALKLNWRPEGTAVFHRQCWAEVKRACRGEGSNIRTLSQIDCKMVEEAERTAEFHDSDPVVTSAAQQVAQLLRDSRYAIAFTGAGISTAAGIGDFRGKDGHWTNRDKQKAYGQGAKHKARKYRISDLRPTYSHEALVKLLEMGLLKFVISQNTDGLHRLSGIPGDKISELHGNCFVEKCEKCGRRYERQSPCRSHATAETVRCPECRCVHRTGRRCESEGCKGYLMNTIINFGDNLESDVLDRACQNASRNDLVLCLGTTLKVSPANSLVTMGRSPPTLVLCNRQPTPYDEVCGGGGSGVRVFGDCDRLMRMVMRLVLGEDHLARWEAERNTRMEYYSSQRPS